MDKLMHIIKLLTNVLSILIKIQSDGERTGLNLGIKHLDNRLNDDMNNMMSIDFANRDHLDDTDYLLSRFCQEFPRWSTEYKSRHSSMREK